MAKPASRATGMTGVTDTALLASKRSSYETTKAHGRASPADPRYWKVVGLVAVVFAVHNVRLSMVGSFLPGEVVARGGDVQQLGAIMLAPLLGLILTCLPAMGLCRRHGALAVMRRGLVAGAVLPFVTVLVGDGLRGGAFTSWFVGVRAVEGVVQGFVEVAGLSMLLRRAHGGERVTLSLGLSEVVRSLATVVGPIVGGLAYQWGLSGSIGTREPAWYASPFRAPFLVVGVASACAAILAARVDDATVGEGRALRHSPAEGAAAEARVYGDAHALSRMPQLWALALAHALSFGAVGLLEATFAPFMLAPPFAASLSWVGAHMTIGSVGVALAALATSSIASQLGAGQIAQLVSGQQMQALGLVLLGVCVTATDAALAYTLACCGTGLALVNSAALLSRLVRTFDEDPRHFAEILAALYVANFAVGYGLSSQVGGALVTAVGFRVTALGFALLASLAPAVLLLLTPRCLGRALAAAHALHPGIEPAAELAEPAEPPADAPDAALKEDAKVRHRMRWRWGVCRWSTWPNRKPPADKPPTPPLAAVA